MEGKRIQCEFSRRLTYSMKFFDLSSIFSQTISREINDLALIETSKVASSQNIFNPSRFPKRKAKIQSIKSIY